MLYRKLGRAGLKVSAISLGSWITFGQSIDDASTEACMRAAYEGGVNFFDGAEAYGQGQAELAMGRVLKKAGWPRDTLIISSKVIRIGEAPTQGGLSRKHLVEACDAALRRMGLEYLDLFFCHRPDPDTEAEEVVHTMNELIGRGKIFYWGTSEFSAAELRGLYAVAQRDRLVGPTMEQCHHNMLDRSRVHGDLVPIFEEFGIGTTIYSPLAQGVLTGKYSDGVPEDSRLGRATEPWLKKALKQERVDGARRLAPIAQELGLSMPQLALAWCLRDPNVSTAIIGATKPAQVTDNIAACDAVERLTDNVMQKIETVLNNRPGA